MITRNFLNIVSNPNIRSISFSRKFSLEIFDIMPLQFNSEDSTFKGVNATVREDQACPYLILINGGKK